MDARGGNELRCSTCLKTFSSKGNLNQHRVTHDPDAKVKCEICGKFLKTPLSLSHHIKMLHTNRHRSNCDICHRLFATHHSLQSHIDTVHNKTKRPGFPCEFPGCTKTYLTRNGMLKHKRTEHKENLTRFPCTLCGKEFKNRQALEIHIATHTKEKAYTCSTCGRSFSQRTAMQRHEVTHAGKSTRRIFKCELCPQISLTRDLLQRHIQAVHEKQRNHPCTFCHQGFSKSANLRRHVEAKHPSNPEKVHSCDNCEFTTLSKDNLVQHARRHNPVNRRECYFCRKELFYSSDMVSHVRRHTLEY